MRWPLVFTPWRVTAAVQALRDNRDCLAAELDRERQRHLDDVLTLCLGSGLKAMQFGNVAAPPRAELLAHFREVALAGGNQVFVVTGAGRIHGVHWVYP